MSELPIIERGKKRYYFDARLGQLRNVDNPHDFINLSPEGTIRLQQQLIKEEEIPYPPFRHYVKSNGSLVIAERRRRIKPPEETEQHHMRIPVLTIQERDAICEVLTTDWVQEGIEKSVHFSGKLAEIKSAIERLCTVEKV